MHPDDHPAAGGITRLIRPRGTRRVLSLMAATVLAAAALLSVSASSADADGDAHPHSITGCTINGVQHLELFLTEDAEFGGAIDIVIDFEGVPDGMQRMYFWLSVIYPEGSQWNVNFESAIAQQSPTGGFPSNSWNPIWAGEIWVTTYSAVDGTADDATGPVGDPLCSLTTVFANLDGSDPRPAPPSTPVSAPTVAVACSPLSAPVGATVTCAVTGGDPGIDILWRASYNPVFAEAGVTLDADGNGSFSFVVPAAARGQEVMVELVEWTAPVSLGVAGVGSLVPTSVPAGEGRGVPAGALAVFAGVALVAGVALRREAVGRVG